MGIKNKNKMIIGRRVKVNEDNLFVKLPEDSRKEEYLRLKDRLKSLVVDDIYNKIETAKILSLINEKKLYIFDGYKSFYGFLADFKIAKSQAYKYIKIASGMAQGIIDYDFIINNGIENTIKKLGSKNSIKKSKHNLTKQLCFQFKNQDSYDFYKSDTKFVCFVLDELFINNKEYLENLHKKYKHKLQKGI
ncbi:chromosome replication/partitioning protein [Borrelia hispanica]|uniref:chromosome replication/partitioning protein n=1 Tax=Borrelia hispanica TaxID=40835 RepID=UPI0004639FDA|nr:chromosome replication/partitioning protein [Borrelia hispanica]